MPASFTSIETMRATPVRAGGSRPAVRLKADIERPFTLETTETFAREIGAHLYEEVEIECEVVRDATGQIESGRLLAFTLLSDEPDLDLWRRWYRANASYWDGVDDIEAELGR